ncbi:hypothetical protein HDU86_008481 [Geranomyces michiganensis]|nr:hypothetical protein HDU86_008481 [Geranomyces michiganensis]
MRTRFANNCDKVVLDRVLGDNIPPSWDFTNLLGLAAIVWPRQAGKKVEEITNLDRPEDLAFPSRRLGQVVGEILSEGSLDFHTADGDSLALMVDSHGLDHRGIEAAVGEPLGAIPFGSQAGPKFLRAATASRDMCLRLVEEAAGSAKASVRIPLIMQSARIAAVFRVERLVANVVVLTFDMVRESMSLRRDDGISDQCGVATVPGSATKIKKAPTLLRWSDSDVRKTSVSDSAADALADAMRVRCADADEEKTFHIVIAMTTDL